MLKMIQSIYLIKNNHKMFSNINLSLIVMPELAFKLRSEWNKLYFYSYNNKIVVRFSYLNCFCYLFRLMF